MRAIIIKDEDARALLDQLKLDRFQGANNVRIEGRTAEQIMEDVHGRFHYIVCRWLQEQGASVVR